DPPLAGPVRARDCAQERRLAGAVRSDQRDRLPHLDRQVEIPDRRQEPVACGDAVHLEQAHAALPRYASTTRASRITTSGGPSAITLPSSMQTSRPTTWTSPCTMRSIQTIAMPRARSS